MAELDGEIIPPSPRRGGFPRGARRNPDGTLDRSSIGGANEEPQHDPQSEPRPKQGQQQQRERPKTKPAPKTIAQIKAEWAKQLKGGHDLASLFTGVESFRITDEESIILADPFVDTLEYLGIPIDGGAFPPLTLLLSVIMVYGPKLKAIEEEIRAKQAKPADAREVKGEDFPPAYQQAA